MVTDMNWCTPFCWSLLRLEYCRLCLLPCQDFSQPCCRESAQDRVTAIENQVVQAHSVAKGLVAKLVEKEDSMQQLEEEKSQAEKAW